MTADGLLQCLGIGFMVLDIGGLLMIIIGILVGGTGVVADQIIGGGQETTCLQK